MKIADSIKSALIIDNKESEVEGLKNVLLKEGIYYTFYTPEDINKNEKIIKNHQIIFMDFSLDDTKTNPVENIGLIRKTLKEICKDGFGSYGLVLWTKHIENIQLFKEKLTIDAENKDYITPLFVIGLKKDSYLQKGYDSLWEDLNNELIENKAAFFFFNWRNTIGNGADNTLRNLYGLIPDYTKQERELQFLLYSIAYNYAGVYVENGKKYEGMYQDAYKAFDEILYHDLISEQKNNSFDFFQETIYDPWQNEPVKKITCFANLNGRMYIDENVNSSIVLPGYVYHVETDIPSLKSNKNWPDNNYTWVALDITPPCDVAQNKTSYSRLIGGFMLNCTPTKEELKSFKNKYDKDYQFNIYPVMIDSKIKWITIDFSCIYILSQQDLLNHDRFKLLFKVKNGLYAEAQRLFIAHAGRLGTSLLRPY